MSKTKMTKEEFMKWAEKGLTKAYNEATPKMKASMDKKVEKYIAKNKRNKDTK